MQSSQYLPILELTRGETVESVHFGAFAIVDSHNELLGSYGDPNLVTFLRSSAKPFQALPFIESGGAEFWGFSQKEVAITCASHSGTEDHAATLASMQAKIGITQQHLRCGIHAPTDKPTANALLIEGREPTQNRHNCSGKHTGMLASAQMQAANLEDYLDDEHLVQKQILTTFCEMCDSQPDEVALGIDGCSAPNFAIPLRNAALGFARLVDPWELSPARAKACKKITAAMTHHPEMVAGPRKFDTVLMAATDHKIVSKGGAEGYQAIGILPGVLGPDSPGVGIAIKIADGDSQSRVRPAVTLAILQELGALSTEETEALAKFGPEFPIFNWRKILVGAAKPLFKLN